MRSNPRRTILAVSACIMLALSGCGGDEPEPNPDPAAQPQESVSPPPAPQPKNGKADPEEYRGKVQETKNNFYFTNLDRTYSCTIAETFVGCNSSNFPKGTPELKDTYGQKIPANAVAFDYGKPAKFQALSNPSYTYIDSKEPLAGGQELPPGAKLTAHGTTCQVTKDGGVSCTHKRHGFTVTPNKADLH